VYHCYMQSRSSGRSRFKVTQKAGAPASSTAVDRPNLSSSESIETSRAQIIAEALEVADLNALRLTLLQLTGDPELRDMPLESVPIRNGRVWQTVVHRDYQKRLKEMATEYLIHEGRDVPPPPDEATTVELLNNFSGDRIPDFEIPMATENLALTEFPGELKEGLDPGTIIPEDFHATIIGAGHTGVALAIYLQRLGIRFTIVERHPRFGGTWVANHYPGLRVDVTGFLYQYRFAPYKWSGQFPTQAEVLEYVDFVVDRYNLRPSARLGTSVEKADWDEETCRWTVQLSDGTSLSSNIVISASGLFATAHTPDIPGLSNFDGTVLHTADWDDDCDLDGKTVALIGNGSSGTQIMPWLAAHASKVYAFQRTPNWIVPAVTAFDAKVPSRLHWLFDNLPYYQNWHIYALQDVNLRGQLGHELDEEWYAEHGTLSQHNDALRKNLTDYIAEQLEGRPDLIEKCIPKQAPLSRRLIVDNGWYESLKRPNVQLVTECISQIDDTGIVTSGGEHYEVDAVVLGSGFDVSRYFWPVTYKGASGVSLEDAWRSDGARAYLGMNYPDFPNFFSCYGPNSHPRSGSFHSWTEAWARYVSSLVVSMLNRGARKVTVRREPFEEFNAALDERFKSVVWGAVPSGGYYINPQGRPGVHMPYRAHEYYDMLTHPRLSDYEFK
jgi:4-hydroxyacetophenone monooxygenase